MYRVSQRVEYEHISQVVTYMRRMPASFAVPFLKAVQKRNKMFLRDASVSAWATDNRDIIAAVV
jgi:hypothetical protein